MNGEDRALAPPAMVLAMICSVTPAPAQTVDFGREKSDIPEGFSPITEEFYHQRREEMVAMRDGVKLFTVILIPKWTKEPFPSDWRLSFTLDGFSVPRHGDVDGKWDVCYFAAPTGHFFTAQFDGGRVTRVVVDG